jgi:hypothetical protein
VRLVNFALGTPALDVSVSGEPIPLWNSVPYEGSGGYVDLPAGTYTLEANAGTGSGTLLGPPLTFNAGTVYSVFAVGWFDSGPGGTLLVPLSLVLAVDKGPIIVYMPIVMRDFTSP